jgi:hypothetical protein
LGIQNDPPFNVIVALGMHFDPPSKLIGSPGIQNDPATKQIGSLGIHFDTPCIEIGSLGGQNDRVTKCKMNLSENEGYLLNNEYEST